MSMDDFNKAFDALFRGKQAPVKSALHGKIWMGMDLAAGGDVCIQRIRCDVCNTFHTKEEIKPACGLVWP